jgi:uncharacterized protein YjiK
LLRRSAWRRWGEGNRGPCGIRLGLLSLLLPASIGAQAPPRTAITLYDLDVKDPAQFDLVRSLREISGLAVGRHGRLFAHQDERAIVYELNPADGSIVKRFFVGRNGQRGDFEGIAIVGDRMFLVSAGGTLLEFREAAADSVAEFTRTDMQTRDLCREIEGIDYDAATDRMLLACKLTAGRAQRDRLIVLSYSLRDRRLDPQPRFSLPLNTLDAEDPPGHISPSGIAVHPVTGTVLVLAARENMLLELSRGGAVLGAVELRGKVHHQVEGIAFAPDGTLYLADEGRSGRATLTVYPLRR